MKRLLILADLHCGHVAGLTPPRWQISGAQKTSPHRTKREKWAQSQRETWDWYVRNVTKHGPYDVVVCNGDVIDGPGDRTGGTEQLTTDRHEQCEMGVVCLQRALRARKGRRPKLIMTYGTPYHTGDKEDWEGMVATDLNAAKIGSHEWIDVEGLVFDCKHYIGRSNVPHTRHTTIARDALWSLLWAERGLVPRSHVIVRSHVHYHQYCGDADTLRLTTPALQTLGQKYGSRRCSGTVDFGFLVFEVSRGAMDWRFVEGRLKHQKATAIRV